VADSRYAGLGEVLIEFIPSGNSVKVCAVDPKTGIEVSIIGPASASSTQLKRNAMAKLVYVLNKRRAEKSR